MYDDVDYARTRLNETIVMDKEGKASYVHNLYVEDGIMSAQCSVLGGDSKMVKLEDLTLRGFKLGYLNKNGKALYLLRVPKRRDWRQGLRTNNVIGYISKRRCDVASTTIMEALEATYPSVKEASKMLLEGWTSVAISRHYAIERVRNKYVVTFRSLHKAGSFDIETGEATLSESHKRAAGLFSGG